MNIQNSNIQNNYMNNLSNSPSSTQRLSENEQQVHANFNEIMASIKIFHEELHQMSAIKDTIAHELLELCPPEVKKLTEVKDQEKRNENPLNGRYISHTRSYSLYDYVPLVNRKIFDTLNRICPKQIERIHEICKEIRKQRKKFYYHVRCFSQTQNELQRRAKLKAEFDNEILATCITYNAQFKEHISACRSLKGRFSALANLIIETRKASSSIRKLK